MRYGYWVAQKTHPVANICIVFQLLFYHSVQPSKGVATSTIMQHMKQFDPSKLNPNLVDFVVIGSQILLLVGVVRVFLYL
jgi:hypothetical protein